MENCKETDATNPPKNVAGRNTKARSLERVIPDCLYLRVIRRKSKIRFSVLESIED